MADAKKRKKTKRKQRVFKSLEEVRKAYFPKKTLEELEGREKQGVLIILPRPGVK